MSKTRTIDTEPVQIQIIKTNENWKKNEKQNDFFKDLKDFIDFINFRKMPCLQLNATNFINWNELEFQYCNAKMNLRLRKTL